MININAEAIIHYINRPFLSAFQDQSRYLILYGGAGSGKSVAAAQKCIIRILQAIHRRKAHRILCLRKTTPSVRKSSYEEIRHWLHKWDLYSLCAENKTAGRIQFPFGSELLFMGLDNPEKLKSIHGITSIWMEEATEFTQDDFMQIDLRLRGHTWDYKQILMTFNPINPQTWLYRMFFDNQPPAKPWRKMQFGTAVNRIEAAIMHSTCDDNSFIDEAYKIRLEQLKNEDPEYHKIYRLGEWGRIEGLIFPNWILLEEWPQSFDRKAYGIDFGYASNPTAIIETGILDKRLYLRECFYRSGMQNRQIADICKAIMDKDPKAIFVADSAEPKSIDEIRTYGIPILPSIKGKDSVLYGIQRMKQYEICIDAQSVNLIKEFKTYKWAETKDGKSQEVPLKYNDHGIDAVRYALTYMLGKPVRVDFFMKIEKKSVDNF